jgi:hypothetical protein
VIGSTKTQSQVAESRKNFFSLNIKLGFKLIPEKNKK